MEQQTGSKWEKEYVKAVYCHPAYLTCTQVVKKPAANAGDVRDMGLIPGSGCQAVGTTWFFSLQYPRLENPMDGGACLGTVHRVAESRTSLSDVTFSQAPGTSPTLPQPAPSRARSLEAGERWARLAQARAASRPGLCAIAPGRRAAHEVAKVLELQL